MRVLILGFVSLALMAGCSAQETEAETLARLCDSPREDGDKDGLAKVICAHEKQSALVIFTTEQSVFLLKTIDEVPLDNPSYFTDELAKHPELFRKVECLQAMMIYGTDDQDLLAGCLAAQ